MRRSRLKTWLSPILILAFLGAGEVEAQHPPTPPVPSSNGAEAMQALQAAERHYFQNDYEAAVRALSEYIAQYPDSPYLNQAYLRLGQSYDRLEEDAKARQAFAQAVALEPNDPLAMQAVSYWGNLYVRRYQYLEAAAMCETVMRTYPKTRAAEMAHYLLGNYYYAANRIEQAIQAYRSFLEEHVGSIYFRSAFRQLISLLLLDDRAAEAEAFLDRFLSDSPDDAQLIEQLAEVYRRQKRYEDAVRLLSGALAKRPNDTALWQALGEVYAEQGDRQAAREVWSQMAQHGEASYSTYQQLGMLYRRYEYFDEAAEAFRKAIQMQPGYAYLYIQLAEVYAIQGKREEALRVYLDALLQIGPIYANRASLVSALSELFPPERLKERLAEAEAKLRERSGQSQDANLILTLAELNLILGRVDQAIKDFERLAALFPDRGQLLVQYAQQYREAHDLRTARALYEAAVRLFPEASETPLWWMALGEIAEQEGRWSEAYAAYQRAQELDRSGRTRGEVSARLLRILSERLRRPQEAIALVNRLLADPARAGERPLLQLYAARAWMQAGDYARAEDALQQARSLRPDEAAEIEFLQGELAFFQERWEEALEAYRQVVERFPAAGVSNDAVARMALIQEYRSREPLLQGYVGFLRLLQQGKNAEALEAGRALVARSPTASLASEVRLALAELLEAQGRTEEAIRELEAAAQGEGASVAAALLRLGALQAARGETDAALDAYQRLLELYPDGAYALQAQQAARETIERSSEQPGARR